MASLDELLYDLRRIEEHRVELTEKRIQSIYRSLMKDLNSFISEEYVKYADKDGKLFLSYLDSKNKRAKFLAEIAKNVDGISPKVKQEMLDLVDKTYERTFKGIAKAVKEADDTKELLSGTKTLVRPEVLKQSVKNNIEKLTLDAVMEKHRAEIIADIQQTLTVSLMNGDRYETMAKRIQERLGVSYSKATNIARTESHRNIESGLLDGAKETAHALEGSGLIYAATWRTMKDERVRPQQRRKTKKGWKTTISKNGANHMKMDGVTIKVGEKFRLESDVFAECPGKSGTARNDCRCRCFLRYSLMTVEEFAKATGQTEEAVRQKYHMPVNENELTHKEEHEKVETPRSLEKFDTYQQNWVKEHYDFTDEEIKTLQNGIKSVIDRNAYSMRVNAKDLQNIIDNGFMNQFQTGTSGGMLSSSYRKTASYRLFGNEAHKMADNEFEKYGYLGSLDFIVDAKTSACRQYGKTIVKFDKERLADRVTYTLDDSLGNALSNEVVGGKIGEECSISGLPIFDADSVLDYFEESDMGDIGNADDFAQIVGCRYFELQYHGDLTIDDVESICFTGKDIPDKKTIQQLKDKKIKVYELEGGELNEM